MYLQQEALNFKKKDERTELLCHEGDGEEGAHLLLNCLCSALVQEKCASLFGMHIDMAKISTAWERTRVWKGNRGLVAIIVAAICQNIWTERNVRIFNNTSHTVDSYVAKTYIDVSF